MNEYNFNKDKIKDLSNESENTSAVSTIAYEVENAKVNGLTDSSINRQINKLKDICKFPSNLDYVDSFYDPKSSLSCWPYI